MIHPQRETSLATLAAQHPVQPTRGIFAKHQVLTVSQGKCLFVSTLYQCLRRRTQRMLNAID
ncbi:hypothetical protein D3C80_1978540 [compost metagenome]